MDDTLDKDGILNHALSEAGIILFLTARVLKAENFLEGRFFCDGEWWEIKFSRLTDFNISETQTTVKKPEA